MKPYLNLKDRVSQAWLNKYTILLILIALKILLFHQSLDSSLTNSRDYTLNSCSTIDTYVSNMVSFPHYIAKSSNFLMLKTIEEINEKTLDTLDLIITGSEHIIIFALEMVVGTYACLLVSAIDGAVDVAVNSTEHIISWVNDTLDDVTDTIEDGLTDISKILNKAVDAAETVKDFFEGDDNDEGNSTLSHVNLTVNSLKNLNIPSSINSKLEELKDGTPDFQEVKNKTENLIKTPFELIRSKMGNTTIMSTDGDTLYVPELQNLTICSDNSEKINKFYEDLSKDVMFLVKVFVALLLVGAVMALIPIIWEEYKLWRKLKFFRSNMQPDTDPIELMEKTFNRIPATVGTFTAKKTTNTTQSETNVRWLISYILSSRALILLGIALAGLLAVALQFIILSSLTKALHKAKSPFKEITSSITDHIDDSITTWTVSTNDYLSDKETSINDDLFSWVKIATDSVNNTISTFVEDMNDAIFTAFNGTILYDPVNTVVGCMIEDKLIKIEKGLTWIHDNAEITLPRVEDDYLTQAWSNDTSSANSTDTGGVVSKAGEVITKTEDMMSSMLKTIVRQYKRSLMLELYISLALLVIWFIQFLIGLVILYVRRYKNPDEQFQEKMEIGYPRPLTEEEQKLYGYPLTSNIKVINIAEDHPNTTNVFDDSNKLANPFSNEYKIQTPFLDEKASNENRDDNIDDDDKSTLTEIPKKRITRITNPFDEFESDAVSNVLSRYDFYEENDLGHKTSRI